MRESQFFINILKIKAEIMEYLFLRMSIPFCYTILQKYMSLKIQCCGV